MNKQHATILLYSAGGLLGVAGIFLYNHYFSVKSKSVRNAVKEWKDWGSPEVDQNNNTIRTGGKENEEGFAERVQKYWKEGVGKNYSGYDRNIAWSSALISYLFKTSGAKDKFVYSPSHSDYIRDSISNRKRNDFSKPFIGLKVNEYAPKKGDLVCYSREQKEDLYDETGGYRSHCDLVVKKNKGSIEVIGGNVGHAVTKKILITDENGFLIDKNHNWFTVIKSNL